MATITTRTGKDGTLTHRVRVRLKGHPVQSATFRRKTDARRWIQNTESAIREGRYFKTAAASRHTVAELVDRYIQEVLPRKPKSLAKQSAQLLFWKDRIGYYTLAAVTPALIAEQRNILAGEITVRGTQRSPATVNRLMAALSHAFSIAVKEWGWLDDSPMRRVSKLKEPRGRVRFLCDDERTRLLTACRECNNPYLYPAVVLSLSTGARQMEIMTLRWSDIDLQRGIIVLHETKNGERRALPLQGHALALIKDLGKVRRLDTDLLFPSHASPQKPQDLRAAWEAALRKAEITDFRWHDLRHSAASYLAMNGATLAEIAEVLGHKTLAMVKRYSHLSEQHTSAVVARMNAAIFGEC
jgi:integrase